MSEQNEEQAVSVEFAPNGPALVTGTIRVKENGAWTTKSGRFALCRCGHSQKKPYCDGGHRAAGFVAGE